MRELSEAIHECLCERQWYWLLLAMFSFKVDPSWILGDCNALAKGKVNNLFYYMIEAICRAISPEQSLLILPGDGGHKHFRFSATCFNVIKGIKSSLFITIWLLTLGIRTSNARTLRAWALPFPCLGSITMLIWTFRVSFLL